MKKTFKLKLIQREEAYLILLIVCTRAININQDKKAKKYWFFFSIFSFFHLLQFHLGRSKVGCCSSLEFLIINEFQC
jgi:hypothetical protein